MGAIFAPPRRLEPLGPIALPLLVLDIRILERLEIGDQVGEVLGAQALGQAVGHERDVAALPLVDLVLGDPDQLGVGVLDLDGLGGLVADDPGEDAAVGQGERVGS